MSQPMYEPRQVEPNAGRRWARSTLWFVFHSPITVTALFVALTALTSALDAAHAWASRLTSSILWVGTEILLYPSIAFLLLLVMAIARSAESSRGYWEAVSELARSRGVLGSALHMLLVGSIIHVVLGAITLLASLVGGFPLDNALSSVSAFDKCESDLAFAMVLGIAAFGPFSMPLAISSGVWDLELLVSIGTRAREVNTRVRLLRTLPLAYLLMLLIGVAVLIETLFAIPAVVNGLTIFVLVFQYVAFRDVFEHRDPPRRADARAAARSSRESQAQT